MHIKNVLILFFKIISQFNKTINKNHTIGGKFCRVLLNTRHLVQLERLRWSSSDHKVCGLMAPTKLVTYSAYQSVKMCI